MRAFVLSILVLASGCYATKITGPMLASVPSRIEPTTVVIEPFFENAEWEMRVKSEEATVYGTFGGGPPTNVVVQREVPEKPLLAQVPALAKEHALVLDQVRKLRPRWNVLSTGQMSTEGPAVLIRTLVGSSYPAGSDRTLKSVLSALGLGIPALFVRVHEGLRTGGTLSRFDSTTELLRGRLIRYPTQPDYAIDTRNLPVVEQAFGFDLEYEEGVMARESARNLALVEGFAERVAIAIVAVIEGVR